MKSIQTLIGAVAVFAVTAGNAFAAVCGVPGAPACNVPEPGSLALVTLAIAGVALVARKKK